jgi:hypothetical protein
MQLAARGETVVSLLAIPGDALHLSGAQDAVGVVFVAGGIAGEVRFTRNLAA